MAFKAKLVTLQTSPSGNDTVDATILYYTAQVQVTKSYNFHASNFKTVADVKNFIVSECATLDSFQAAYVQLKNLVGLDDIVAQLP